MVRSIFQNVNETEGISMILVCSLDVQFQNVNKTQGNVDDFGVFARCPISICYKKTSGITMIKIDFGASANQPMSQ